MVALPGVVLRDHWLDVPLDHAEPGGERIRIYAREVRAPDDADGRPWLLFLQGGPGGESPRPHGADAWLAPALKDFRVLLLDQRGTGRSTPITPRLLAERGDAAAQADYLARHRADAIVRDAEAFRAHLGAPPWSTLGQSYGGFCTLSYLSLAPEGLQECLVTGGLAGLDADAAEVYRRTYPRVERKNAEFYARYPEDEAAARRVADHLVATEVVLPTGERLTAERFQTLGMAFGQVGGYETVHYLLERAWDGPDLAPAFLTGVAHETSYATRPLFVLLHEACYAQGAATNWTAQRVRPAAFDAAAGGRLLFTGEMVYPWMLGQEPAITPYAEVAERLAARTDWPPLYDVERLATNTVPVAAAVYFDDMYVDADLSLATAAHIPNVRIWVTNEMEHNGLRVAAERVFGRLLDMRRGRA